MRTSRESLMFGGACLLVTFCTHCTGSETPIGPGQIDDDASDLQTGASGSTQGFSSGDAQGSGASGEPAEGAAASGAGSVVDARPDGESPPPDAADASEAGASGTFDDGGPKAARCGGAVCASGAFCATASATGQAESPQCAPATFGDLCDNPKATLVSNAFDDDNAAEAQIAAALATVCTGMSFATAPVPDGGTGASNGPVDPVSGEPQTGIGNVCLIAGGGFGQPAVNYLDSNAESDVYATTVTGDAGMTDIVFAERDGASGATDVTAPEPLGIAGSDDFVVELAVDPESGSLCMASYGTTGSGTLAAAYFIAHQFVPSGDFGRSDKSWYVYHWVAAYPDAGGPSGQDTYTLVASGP